MSSSAAFSLRSFRKQHILTEYASLKHVQLQGIYLCPTPGNPSFWIGVIFVRKGVYAGAVLRFNIKFPDAYPLILPIVTFTSEIFHPLVQPKFSNSSDVSVSSSDLFARDAYPPGFLSLECGKADIEHGGISIVGVLIYVRRCLQDESILNNITLQQALNPTAWNAWNARRGSREHRNSAESLKGGPIVTLSPSDSASDSQNERSVDTGHSREWDERVQDIVRNSSSEEVLFEDSPNDDLIHFVDSKD